MPPPEPKAPTTKPATTGSARFGRLRVLIIDDVPTVRSIVRKMLTTLGFKVVFEAENGEEGLRALGRAVPDIILCDIMMKPMNGLEFVDALHRRGYTGDNQLPVIFLTSNNDEETVMQALAVGAAGFLVKPVRLEDLRGRLKAVADKYGL